MTGMVLRAVLIMWMASVAAQGQAGVVREWQALLSTRDGMNAAEYLKNKAQPDVQKLERMESATKHDRAKLAARIGTNSGGCPGEPREKAPGTPHYEGVDGLQPCQGGLGSKLRSGTPADLSVASRASFRIHHRLFRTEWMFLDPGFRSGPETHKTGPEDFTSRVVQFYDATRPDALRF